MEKSITLIIFIALMVAIIISVDILFFRQHVWARLLVNIGIVLIFAALYLRFLR